MIRKYTAVNLTGKFWFNMYQTKEEAIEAAKKCGAQAVEIWDYELQDDGTHSGPFNRKRIWEKTNGLLKSTET